MRHTPRNERLGAAESPVHVYVRSSHKHACPMDCAPLACAFQLCPCFVSVLGDSGSRTGQGRYELYAGIYYLFRLLCSCVTQLPENSYFLFGEQPYYSLASLEAVGLESGLDLFQRRGLSRETRRAGIKLRWASALWPSTVQFILSGLAFGLMRRKMRASNLKIFLLFSFPMALDGFTQLVGPCG